MVADMIKQNQSYIIPADLLEKYSKEEIIEGAIEIIAAEIASKAEIRDILRQYFQQNGILSSGIKSDKMLEKLNEKTREEVRKFEIHKEFSSPFSRVKSYQMLAMNRGENLGILTVKLEKDDESLELIYRCLSYIGGAKGVSPQSSKNSLELEEAIKKGYKALFESLETELRNTLTEIAEDDSIRTFKQNLANLLMTKPEYGKRILGIDPGYRTGSKLVILDELGNPLEFGKIFTHDEATAVKILTVLIAKYSPEVIAIGNGTGSDETVAIVQKVTNAKIYIVNESGASVYSASETAQEEFPDLDVTDRGTISIARRYIDPLSELVKIPVGSIGVGMYQHDIAPKKLEEKLDNTIEDVVNQVGVNVNTASVHVLCHISGLDKRSAKKLYGHRPYKNRASIAKVLSEKVYEQAAGFLRVPESSEPLDNTNIHPEQYALAREIIARNLKSSEFSRYAEDLRKLYPEANATTIDFILESYATIGKDPRILSSHLEVRPKKTLEELKEGDILDGVVRNVVAFGAFVDIGMKNDGLVHVSQLADCFVKDPNDIVKVGQKVRVRLTGIDKTTGKIQLSMKEAA